MTAAARQQRRRERAARGRIVLTVEVNENALAGFLIKAGLLREEDGDSRKALVAALERSIELSTREFLSRVTCDDW